MGRSGVGLCLSHRSNQHGNDIDTSTQVGTGIATCFLCETVKECAYTRIGWIIVHRLLGEVQSLSVSPPEAPSKFRSPHKDAGAAQRSYLAVYGRLSRRFEHMIEG